MYGAIIGDVVGSIYEFNNHKSKDFEFFDPRCFFTDDTAMSLAIARAVLDVKNEGKTMRDQSILWMQRFGMRYQLLSYGTMFLKWLFTDDPKPYNSYGNGSAMRVSACGWAGDSLEEVAKLAEDSAAVSHNHEEGILGAVVTAKAIYMARTGASMWDIRHMADERYMLNGTIDKIRQTYRFDETCFGTVPVALEAFLESTSFEDAIRNAISVGGDSDTLAAITGSVAEAYYGVPKWMKEKVRTYLDDYLLSALDEFEAKYPSKTT